MYLEAFLNYKAYESVTITFLDLVKNQTKTFNYINGGVEVRDLSSIENSDSESDWKKQSESGSDSESRIRKTTNDRDDSKSGLFGSFLLIKYLI